MISEFDIPYGNGSYRPCPMPAFNMSNPFIMTCNYPARLGAQWMTDTYMLSTIITESFVTHRTRFTAHFYKGEPCLPMNTTVASATTPSNSLSVCPSMHRPGTGARNVAVIVWKLS